LKPLIVHRIGEAILGQNGLSLENLPQEFQGLYPNESPKYIDNLSLLAGVAAGRALEGNHSSILNEQLRDFGVILGNAFGAIDGSLEFDRLALLKGPSTVNPMDFPNTVANAAGSRIGIWLQLKGPNVTLTNGETSFIDAIGYAWEGYNSGLFQRCLAGAAEKIPPPFKSLAAPVSASVKLMEGACLLLASGESSGDDLFKVLDYFSVQLKPDLSIPKPFLNRFEALWEGVLWLGCPGKTPLEERFPDGMARFSPDPSVLELGLGGVNSLKQFLSSSFSCGLISTYSKMERKFSFIKIIK
jgi:hypothetical protein